MPRCGRRPRALDRDRRFTTTRLEEARRGDGQPRWATDASLAAIGGRLARMGEVECHMDGWTRTHDARPLAETLQQAGIDAAPVLDLGDLHEDPQLAHRRHFREVDHPVIGRHPAEMNAITFSDTPGDIRTPAPKLGSTPSTCCAVSSGCPPTSTPRSSRKAC
jgi:crotonobetainyl-CoA:carnitine CoA-transferase CaiB-like acyl-CoA transferase